MKSKPIAKATPANYRVIYRDMELGIVILLDGSQEVLVGPAYQYLAQSVRRALGLCLDDCVRLERTTHHIYLAKRV